MARRKTRTPAERAALYARIVACSKREPRMRQDDIAALLGISQGMVSAVQLKEGLRGRSIQGKPAPAREPRPVTIVSGPIRRVQGVRY